MLLVLYRARDAIMGLVANDAVVHVRRRLCNTGITGFSVDIWQISRQVWKEMASVGTLALSENQSKELLKHDMDE